MIDKYPFNNCWWVNHPTINFFTFDTEVVTVFGHKCILEKYQDGEIWSDDEYWGSVLYDFDNDRYVLLNTYNWTKKDIENLVNNYGWNGKISEDFNDVEQLKAIDFYKEFVRSDEEDIDKFYNENMKVINNHYEPNN